MVHARPIRNTPLRLYDDAGFTLLEILGLAVIIRTLAAVARQSFLEQTRKTNDASAKVLVRTAQTAAEAYATDHGGSYKAMSVAELQAIEPTLNEKKAAELLVAEELGGGGGYLVEAKSGSTGDTYGIEHVASGEVVRTCAPEKKGSCPAGGHW
jgi:Tfp pilus assembly protein PilE